MISWARRPRSSGSVCSSGKSATSACTSAESLRAAGARVAAGWPCHRPYSSRGKPAKSGSLTPPARPSGRPLIAVSKSPNVPYAAPSRAYARWAGSQAARAAARSPDSTAESSASVFAIRSVRPAATAALYARTGSIRSLAVTGSAPGVVAAGPVTLTSGPVTGSVPSIAQRNRYRPWPSRTGIGRVVPGASPSTSACTAPAASTRSTSATLVSVSRSRKTWAPDRGRVQPAPHRPTEISTSVPAWCRGRSVAAPTAVTATIAPTAAPPATQRPTPSPYSHHRTMAETRRPGPPRYSPPVPTSATSPIRRSPFAAGSRPDRLVTGPAKPSGRLGVMPSTTGAELSERLYRELVEPLVRREFPGLRHAAGRWGPGSDVLGLDDATSRDHDWGCRLTLLVDDADAAA